MFSSDSEIEYTIHEIRQVYKIFQWDPEYLNIASDLLKGVGALDGLRLWVEFGDFKYKGKEVITACGFNEAFIVVFDIGESEPQSIDIGCYGKPPVEIEIEKVIDVNSARYVFSYSVDDCEIYRSEIDSINLASSIPMLAEKVIRACTVNSDKVISKYLSKVD